MSRLVLVAELLERFELDPTRPVGQLSTGNRRVVGIIQAFAHRPELLILDEPTSGLDPLLQHQFQKVLREAVAAGATVFLSSHILPEVEVLAHRVGILRRGRLVAVAGIDELRAQARQRIDFHVDPPADPAVFAGVPEVVSVEAHDGVIQVVVEGGPSRHETAGARPRPLRPPPVGGVVGGGHGRPGPVHRRLLSHREEQRLLRPAVRRPPAGGAGAGRRPGGHPAHLTPGYLHARLFAIMVPVLLLVFGIGAGAKAIGGAEADGTLELLLANPVTRLRAAGERYLAVVILLAVVTGALIVSLVVTAPLVGLLDGVSLPRVVAAGAAGYGIGLLHATVAFAVGCAAGRPGPAVAVTTSLAAAGYLIEGVAAASGSLGPLQAISPWHWYLDRNVLVEGLAPVAVVAPVLAAVALFAVGAVLFKRRDLR